MRRSHLRYGSVPESSRASLPESVAQTMGAIVDRLSWLGIATRLGVVVETDLWRRERRAGGQVALTDLGLWYARPLLPAQGYEVPTPGELADAPAAELLEAIATWPRDAGLQALDLWRNGRLSAADELADAAREATTADRRSFALGVALAPTDRLWHVARLAWRTLPYAFARSGQALAGPVAATLTAPDGKVWVFGEESEALTAVRGPAIEFCLVAGRRLDASATTLGATGPDGDAVLALVRTYA